MVRCHVLWLLSCGCGAMCCGRLVTALQTNLLGVYLPCFSLKMYTAHIWSTKIHGVTSQEIQTLVVSVIRNLRCQSHLITFFALMNKGISFHYSNQLHRSLVCCLCPFCQSSCALEVFILGGCFPQSSLWFISSCIFAVI